MKLAIVGNGMIVGEALKALKQVPSIQVVAICCREQSKEKAETLANQFQIDKIYTNYSAMLQDESIDFVYIGIINSEHYAYSREALLAGKNLIIEKPICITAGEILDLQHIALNAHAYVFEAVTFLHAPFFRTIKNSISQLGTIRLVQCNYSKYSSRYDRYLNHEITPVFDTTCAGGALYDLNIYNLNLVISLFGEPDSVNYFSNKGYNGIDTSGTAILKYSTFVAECTAAKDSYSPCFDIIQGEKGWMRITGSPDDLQKLEICVENETKVLDIQPSSHRMIDEFTEFERIFCEKDYAQMASFLELSVSVTKAAELASNSSRE